MVKCRILPKNAISQKRCVTPHVVVDCGEFWHRGPLKEVEGKPKTGKEELKRKPQLHSRGGSGHAVRCVCHVPAFQFARNPPRLMPSVEVASYNPYQHRSSGPASFQIGEAHPDLALANSASVKIGLRHPISGHLSNIAQRQRPGGR